MRAVPSTQKTKTGHPTLVALTRIEQSFVHSKSVELLGQREDQCFKCGPASKCADRLEQVRDFEAEIQVVHLEFPHTVVAAGHGKWPELVFVGDNQTVCNQLNGTESIHSPGLLQEVALQRLRIFHNIGIP